MSRELARAVLSALKSTAVLAVSLNDTDEVVYLYRASRPVLLATITKEHDELFGGTVYEITPAMGRGNRQYAVNVNQFLGLCRNIKGYPTEADNRRNHSRPVYKAEYADWDNK